MQMQSVETSAGTAISAAPSRMARSTGLPIACCRWKFSTSTVASSTRMPTASAIPPSVMRLIVCPNQLSTMIETRSESGMEVITTTVERQPVPKVPPEQPQLPELIREILADVSHDAIRADDDLFAAILLVGVRLCAFRASAGQARFGSCVVRGGRSVLFDPHHPAARQLAAGLKEHGALRLEDREQRPLGPIRQDHARLRHVAVAHVRHVAQVDHRPVHLLDGKVIEPGDHVRAAVHEHVVFERTDLRGATR